MTFLRKITVAITFFGKSSGSDYIKNVANPTLRACEKMISAQFRNLEFMLKFLLQKNG